MSQATRRCSRIHTCKGIDSESCFWYPIASSCVFFFLLFTPTQALICRQGMRRMGAVRFWVIHEQCVKYLSRKMFSGQVLVWQIHVRNPPVTEARERRMVKQGLSSRATCAGCKKNPSQSIRHPLLVRVKLYPNSGLTELACCVQHGGKSTGCHIHLDFYECFDSSPNGSLLTRWWVFIKACQKSKNWGGRIFADLHCTDRRKKKSCSYSNCNWK